MLRLTEPREFFPVPERAERRNRSKGRRYGFPAFLVVLLFGLMVPVCVGAGENADFLRGKSIYRHGAGDPAEFPKALASFKVAAEAGHAEAQFLLGRMYHLGHGTPANPAQAERWYRLAAKNGSASAWSNLGHLYGSQGKKGKVVLECFMRASEMGSALGSFNAASVFDAGLYGVRKNHARALEYYRKALKQQPGYPGAWNHIGILFEYGGFGVEKDLKAAEKAYLNGVRENEDKHCYYNLYRLYWNGRLPAKNGSALDYLEKAAEHGQGQAAVQVGEAWRMGWWGRKPNLVKAARFYAIAARENQGWCIWFLGRHANDKRLVAAFGRDVTNQWKSRYQKYRKSVRKQVAEILPGVKSSFDAGDEEAAEAALDAALEQWKKQTVDSFSVEHADMIWSEAQVKSGRADLEWARFLFAWLAKIYQRDVRSANILAARTNLDELLIKTGRYGKLRESCAELKRLLRELEGIDFDAVCALVSVGGDYRIVGAENIPLVADADEAMRSRRLEYWVKPSKGEPIGGQGMNAMLDIANERLSVGDMKPVLLVAEWLERWVRKVKSTGKYPPRSFPGSLRLLEQESWKLRAEAFSALGLPGKEAKAWQSIIDLDYRNSYGGRLLHEARYRLAGVLVDLGRANEVDTEALRKQEDRMRRNIYGDREEWLYSKLVRARALAKTGQPAEGMSLAKEVLNASAEKKRPLIRLESLLVAAGLELDAGGTTEVEPWLVEALSWARGKGLLLKELRIYQIYVRYLIAIGEYDQALEMQHRVLALIKALKLAPRLDRANLRLAEIYEMRKDAAAARSLLANIKDHGTKDREIGGATKKLEKRLQNPEDEPAANGAASSEPIDLQPRGIQSMPVGNEETEAIFILANPNPESRRVEVKFHSGSFGLTVERATQDEIALRCEAGAGEASATATIDVPGEWMVPIALTARGSGRSGARAAVTLQAKIVGDSLVRESQWKIVPGADRRLVAVVDAARLRNNPFFLMPSYHHLNAAGDRIQSVALRVVASEPTRVEGFAPDGTLLFVDAQGNGSFGDPGDLVASDQVRNLFPILSTGGERDRIALRYAPESECANGRVEIRIETRVEGGDGTWRTDAVDWLEP